MPKVQSNRSHQTNIDSGLVIAHIGNRAATIDWPSKSMRIELADIPLLTDLLARIASSLVKNGN